MDDVIDRALLERVGRGDDRAFEAFVRRWEGPLYRFLTRTLGSAEAAEEARQVTFVRAHAGAPDYRGGAVSTWLFRIAWRVALNMARSQSRSPVVPLEEAAVVADSAPTQLASLSLEQERTAVRRALATLEAEDRALLWTCVAEGEPVEAAARVFERPASTVRYRLQRALGRLRVALREEGRAGDTHAMR